jgi:hypothetical protein
MWFHSHFTASRPPRNSPPARRASQRRLLARRLLLEGLEDRRLMAFNVLEKYATPGTAEVIAAQIDGDGQLDLVTLDSSTISVRLGNGDGSFGNSLVSAAGPGARAVAAGDLTGDGVADLVTANGTDFSLLVGNGDGTFQSPLDSSLPSQNPTDYPGTTPLPQLPQSVAVGDLNGDGKLDVVVTAQTSHEVFTGSGYYGNYYEQRHSGYVNVLLGNGTGGFSAPAVHPLGTGRSPSAVAVADLNHDGTADVITMNGLDLSVLLGNGASGFGGPIHSGAGASNALSSLSLGDLDGDGQLDTVLRSPNGGLRVQIGDGAGRFTPGADVSLGGWHYPTAAVMGDVNADGELDLVAGSSFSYDNYYWGLPGGTTRHATVLFGTGEGGFSAPQSSLIDSFVSSGYWNSLVAELVLADFTDDGLPELAALDFYMGNVTVLRNDGQWTAEPAITISDVVVTEGDSGAASAVFTVTLSSDHADVVSVDYTTLDYTARGDADFASVAGTLTFAPGVTSRTISVPILDDALDEYDEQFFLELSNAVGGQLSNSRATGTILQDNDPAPRVSINDVSKLEGNSDWTSFVFTVSLSAPSGKGVSVGFFTGDGTAQASDGDFAYPNDGAVLFAAGETSVPMIVYVAGDRKQEANETFLVNLVGADGASISDGQGVGTILNDDSTSSRPSISIGDASVVEGNSGSKSMTFTVTLSQVSSKEVRVNYATANDSAKTGDNDYESKSGTIRFAPGQTTKTISITVNGDKKIESDETFKVKLSRAVNGEISDSLGLGTILNDDVRTTSSKPHPFARVFDAALEQLLSSSSKKRGR